jgi:transposase
MSYTIKDFQAQFPDDASCLAYIFAQRYPKGIICPVCERENAFTPIAGRRAYACACGHHVSPTSGTIFHKSPTSLKSWFYAIFLMSTGKNGVSAKEIERHVGVTYKCAWRMAHQIRKLMEQDGNALSGIVEVDETYVGGSRRMSSKLENKVPVIGMVERGGRHQHVSPSALKLKTQFQQMKYHKDPHALESAVQ